VAGNTRIAAVFETRLAASAARLYFALLKSPFSAPVLGGTASTPSCAATIITVAVDGDPPSFSTKQLHFWTADAQFSVAARCLFHGIFANSKPIPQKSVMPAKTSPAPTKAERAMKAG
jgi:hypothetical protein